MELLLLSKSTTPIIGWIAQLLGWVMNGIYELLTVMGIPNIGLAIILFTIIVYIAMTPLQIHQQKMSKVMAIAQPELNAIQKKYQGKKDTASQQKMQEETMAVYDKYGTSPTGSCLPLLIQMPILFALYQVIYRIPAYITRIGNIFSGLAAKIAAVDGAEDIIAAFVKENKIRMVSGTSGFDTKKAIDFLYALKPAQWTKFEEISQFSAFKADIAAVEAASQKANSFLLINISDSPWDAIKNGFSSITSGNITAIAIGGLIVGILVPFLAWFTQWLNTKLMPQQASANDNQMAAQMNSMNLIMPLFSAFICLTLSMGIGIYWVIGGAIRIVQQVVINRRIANMDPNELIERAKKKNEKKRKKAKDYVQNVNQNARVSTKKYVPQHGSGKNIQDVDYYKNVEKASKNSITAKANMVRSFDEKKILEKKGGNKEQK
ncbi:MAG: YidC/Oxa1 family membrane protein insertase [Eubacterium sp.]|nr:YidC/Oxa1 family membrane protein insertase [Eubacterium sp.]